MPQAPRGDTAYGLKLDFDLGDRREQGALERVAVGRRGDRRRRSVRRPRAISRSRARSSTQRRRLGRAVRILGRLRIVGVDRALDRQRSSASGLRARRRLRASAAPARRRARIRSPSAPAVLEDDEVGRLSGGPAQARRGISGKRGASRPSIPGYSPRPSTAPERPLDLLEGQPEDDRPAVRAGRRVFGEKKVVQKPLHPLVGEG